MLNYSEIDVATLLRAGQVFYPKLEYKATVLKGETTPQKRFFTHPKTNKGSHSVKGFAKLLLYEKVNEMAKTMREAFPCAQVVKSNTTYSYYFYTPDCVVRISDHQPKDDFEGISIVVSLVGINELFR